MPLALVREGTPWPTSDRRVVAQRGRLAEAEVFDREGLAILTRFVEPGEMRIVEAEKQLAEVVKARASGRQ